MRQHQTNPTRGTFYKIPDQYFSETVHVIKKGMKSYHNQEEPKDLWFLKVTGCPGWDPGTEKGYWRRA
jgi:hypothetical protein